MNKQAIIEEEILTTTQRVKVVLEEIAPSSDDWQMRLVQKRKAHGGSVVFEASSVDALAKVALKAYTRRQMASLEFDAAQAVLNLPMDVAPPLVCDPHQGVFVSRWVEGKSLAELITQGTWEDGLIAAGRWLQRLHYLSRRRLGLRRPTTLLVRLCDVTSEIPIEMPAKERAVYKRAAAALARCAAGSPLGLEFPVRVHGDFLPSNLLLSPHGAVALDLINSTYGSRYDDLAQMTSELAVLAEDGPTAGTFDPELVRDVFLSSYGLMGRNARAYLKLAEGIELLRRWNGFANPRYRNPASGRAKGRAVQTILARSGWIN